MYPLHYTDQMGRAVLLYRKPVRIISLVPSQTELLYDLGLGECVVGITKFCIHPKEWFQSKMRIGGTKKLDLQKIKALQPDLIIGNKEENEENQVKELMRLYPVWMSDIKNLDDALHMIASIGEITDKKENALELSNKIRQGFKQFSAKPLNQIRTAYMIWYNPIMCAGNDTFINEMLALCGFQNALKSKRYPALSTEELKRLNPELILLSSEPFPFKEKHIAEFQRACPDALIKLVDGELFSWYGSRLLHSPEYFLNLRNSIEQQLQGNV